MIAEKELRKRIENKVWAGEQLMKRYVPVIKSEKYEMDGKAYYYNPHLSWDKKKQREMTKECISVIGKLYTPVGAKKAAKVILNFIAGKEKANDLIEHLAIVEKRNDPLVRRWRVKVINRDKKCVECGSEKHLQAHHISHWAYDPVNRINPDNGITLCDNCHSEEHPELENLIKSRRGE